MSYNKNGEQSTQKVLCIITSMDAGGAETFLMKIMRSLNKSSSLQMNFCLSVERKCFYEDEIKSLGGEIFRVPSRSKAPLLRQKNIKNLVKNGHYEAVLVSNRYELAVLDLVAAKKGGASKLGYRATSSAIASGGALKNILHTLLRIPAMEVPNVYIAPSKVAAEFVFGKRILKKGLVNYLHNGIDLNTYRFNCDVRNSIRKEMNLEDKTILIHVGRFSAEKNHEFLINSFALASKQKDDLHLLLVGEGIDLDKRREQAKILGLSERITFAGLRKDIPMLLQAADMLLLPSLYEGMPNTVIEAQGAGLPCLVSSTVTSEANITGLVEFLPLDISIWSEKMAKAKCSDERKDVTEDFINFGYDMNTVAKQFFELMCKK